MITIEKKNISRAKLNDCQHLVMGRLYQFAEPEVAPEPGV